MRTTSTKQSPFVRAHRNHPLGMLFFDTPQAVAEEPGLVGYVPVVERAWEILKLDGVLFAHGRPVLYLKESPKPIKMRERIRLHRLFWNQGVANVLVLADPSQVYIYSALATPLQDDATEEGQALVETLTQAQYAQSSRTFFASLETGAYYEKAHFRPDEALDAYLLDNLEATRDEMCESSPNPSKEKEIIHALLGRLLFACYLLDRKIVSLDNEEETSGATGAARLAAILESKRSFGQQCSFLYGWFAKLKKDFNGTMFDQDLDAERKALRPPHMKAISHFLGHHHVRSRQLTLGFWAYDFQMIPVETISAIYESFLTGEGKEAKRKAGAFYTPRFLAEMVLDVASEGMPDIASKRWLDLACGSGIFLVALFSRMATAWLNGQSGKPTYAAQVKAFRQILQDRIQGIDINETACRIACFSLYLAYLDRFNPPDIREHANRTGRALPRLLLTDSETHVLRDNLIPVVRKGDALKDAPELNGAFDVVVGNPPWRERREHLAQRFTEKASAFLRPGGVGCLLLPTALFLNRTDDFQARWLRGITLEQIVNVADFRFLLFKNATRPALIARFRNEQPEINSAVVESFAPKFRRDSLREGCITISPADRSCIPLRNILAAAEGKAAPIIWKRHLWGTPRDQKLLDLLLDMPTLGDIAGPPNANKRWVKGQGFQPYYGKADSSDARNTPKRSPWSADALLLDAGRQFDLWVLPTDCTTLGKGLKQIGASHRSLRRSPDKRLFTPPMVLVSKGFGKVAFCDFPVLFQDAVQSISDPTKKERLSNNL